MAVLVVGGARFADTVSSAIQRHGFDSLGVTSDAEGVILARLLGPLSLDASLAMS